MKENRLADLELLFGSSCFCGACVQTKMEQRGMSAAMIDQFPAFFGFMPGDRELEPWNLVRMALDANIWIDSWWD